MISKPLSKNLRSFFPKKLILVSALSAIADASIIQLLRHFLTIHKLGSPSTLTLWLMSGLLLVLIRAALFITKEQSFQTHQLKQESLWLNNILNFVQKNANTNPEGKPILSGESLEYGKTLFAKHHKLSSLVLKNSIYLSCFIPLLLIISWRFTLLLIFILIPSWILLRKVSKHLIKQWLLKTTNKLSSSQNHTGGLSSESPFLSNWLRIQGLHSSKIQDSIQLKQGRFQKSNFTKYQSILEIKSNLSGTSSELLSHSVSLILLYLSASYPSQLGLEGSTLLAYCGALVLAYNPLKEFSNSKPKLKENENNYKAWFSHSIQPSLDYKTDAIYSQSINRDVSTLIHCTNITFSYPKSQPTLINLDFKINNDQAWLIKGYNGSGKSTLLQLLYKKLHPDSGKIETASNLVTIQKTLKEQKKSSNETPANFLYIPQNPENLFIFEKPLEPQLKQDSNFNSNNIFEAQEFFNFSQLQTLIDRTQFQYKKNGFIDLSNFSGGEKQKLLLWIFMCQAPRLLLLDEPVSALPSEQRPKTLELLYNWAKRQNTTLVVATHDTPSNPTSWETLNL